MPKSVKTPSSVLKSYMEEYGLNPHSLSKQIGLSYASVRMLVSEKLDISVATALKLAKYFGTTPVFWLNLQQEADLSEAGKNKKLQSVLNKIKKAAKPRGKTLSDKRKSAAKIPGAKRKRR